MDVIDWLRSLGLGEYAASFSENRIDAAVLPDLTDDDLKALGVKALGDRKKLRAAIAALPPRAGASVAASKHGASPAAYTPAHLAARILDSRSQLEGERKHVTVLFADIRGSTALIDGLDPEEAERKLGPAVSLMMAAVHEYEGTVNKVQGDGIMALFGAPLAHEDHAVRACLAALAIREKIAAAGSPLELRIGLHSGEVLVRAIHNDLSMDYDAIGPTVHLAGRMEQLAAPGGILITGTTHALAHDFVHTKALGPVAVKGIGQPVDVFDVLERADTRTRWAARATHTLTTFVGRSAELQALSKAADRAARGQGEFIALVGDAGMGKSRLVHQMLDLPELDGWSIGSTGAVPYGRNVPFHPVGILLRSMFALDDSDSREELERKLLEGLERRKQRSDALVQVMRFLLNLPAGDPDWERLDPPQRGNRVISELKSFLLQATTDRPLALVVEDLHWIDAETQRLLDALADSVPAHRLLLVATYRPEYRHVWSGRSYYTQIRVDPLDGADARDMLDTLLGDGAEFVALKRKLIERTEGRPLFIEELVRALRESGVLVDQHGSMRVAGEIDRIDLPRSVQDVLASRIDRLDPELKRLLQMAAVIGRSGTVRLLGAVTGQTAEVLQQGLSRLQQAEFLYQQHGEGDTTYLLKHALTEEVAYASLTQDTRRHVHGLLVDAIERAYAARLEDHHEALAHHALRAELWDKAYRYSRKAAHKAHARSAYSSAIEWFGRALSALDRLADDGTRTADSMDVRLEMRTALWPLGRHDELARRVREAGAIAERIGDKARLANVYNYLTAHHWRAGEHARAIEIGERGLALAREVEDFSVSVTTMQHLGFAHIARGEFNQQVALHRDVANVLVGEAAYLRHGMAGYPAAITRGVLAWGLAELGEFDEALRQAREGVDIARKVNSAMSTVWVTNYLALAHLLRGEAEEAVFLMEPVFDLCQKAEVRIIHSLTASILAHSLTASGDVARGVQLFEHAIQPAYLQHHPEGSGYPRVWFGMALLAAGRLVDSLDQCDQALRTARAQSEKGHEAWALFARGEVQARTGNAAGEARESYRSALEIAAARRMLPLAERCRQRLGS